MLDDGALLTKSFWNSLNKDFANPDAVTYVKTGRAWKRVLTAVFSGVTLLSVTCQCTGDAGNKSAFSAYSCWIYRDLYVPS